MFGTFEVHSRGRKVGRIQKETTTASSASVATSKPTPDGFARSCRFCGGVLSQTFVDLGMSPLCESYLTSDRLDEMEPFYPLHVRVCDDCLLVQLPAYVPPEEIFHEYAYFSSYSTAWLKHASDYIDAMVARFGLNQHSLVVELASNDGYLLQYAVEKGIPCLGIEPAANVAQGAELRGVPTLVEFFGEQLAQKLRDEGHRADLIVANNVLAQVDDINSFVAGMRLLLADHGVVTIEFPHLERLVAGNQFDTIYHEHFSYFSLLTVERILGAHGLVVFDVEELWTHGGSLRVFARHAADGSHPIQPSVGELLERERTAGFDRIETYGRFDHVARRAKHALVRRLIELKAEGATIVGYGAPGKGNTLLNYCGIRKDILDYTVDRNPYKQGKFLPGTRIPILHPDKIFETKPDYVLILPWNFADEIEDQLSGISVWGAKFIIPIPEVAIRDPMESKLGGPR